MEATLLVLLPPLVRHHGLRYAAFCADTAACGISFLLETVRWDCSSAVLCRVIDFN